MSEIHTPAGSAGFQEPQTIPERILNSAVSLLVERGTAATTTVAVQRRAGVSRGALLHHFPTHAELLAATIDELVRRNEAAAREALACQPDNNDPLEVATRVLAEAFAQPAYLAEIELWVVSRVDPVMRSAVLAAERRARRDLDRVIADLFAPLKDHANYTIVIALTTEFVRGLALSGVLRKDNKRRKHLLDEWIRAARVLLALPTSKN